MSNSAPNTRPHPLLDRRLLLRGLVLICTLALVGYLFEVVGLKSLLETSWVDHEIRGKGVSGELLYVVACTLFIALGMPRQMVSFLGGYAFGFVGGVALALLGTLTGSLITFYYARFMGREALAKRFPGKIKKIDQFLSDNPLSMALILRLSPFSANLAVNLAGGVTGVPVVPFFAGSLVGYLPQTIIFALLGDGILESSPLLNTILSAVLFVLSSVLGLWLWRRARARRGLSDEDEAE